MIEHTLMYIIIILGLIKIPLIVYLIWHNIIHLKKMEEHMSKMDEHIKWLCKEDK